jgi:hypothetical protein
MLPVSDRLRPGQNDLFVAKKLVYAQLPVPPEDARMRQPPIKYALFIIACLLALLVPPAAYADDNLPAFVQARSRTTLQEVGQGTYRKFGFTIYRATLWAPNCAWDAAKPYALQLRYARSLSQETIADSTIDNIRDENVTDDVTLASWSADIKKIMPAVEDGDVMIGLAIPGAETILYFNGGEIAKIKDEKFSRAFFNIWLGDEADEDLRRSLLNAEK